VGKLFKIGTMKLRRRGEKRKMRSDYGLYGVAAICFVLATVFAAGLVRGYELSQTFGVAVTIVFLLIGVIAAAVGYSARPKAVTSTQEPALAPAPPAPVAPVEEPAPIIEETTPPPPPPTPIEEVSITEPVPEPAPPQPVEPLEPAPSVTPVEEPAPAETVAEEKSKTTRRRKKKAVA
jgi:outer membrane biosynthesis protein TonB